MKLSLCVPALAVLAMGLCALPAQSAPRRPVTVQLLAINDLHGNLEPVPGPDGQVNGVAAGGAEYLAAHIKAAEQANPNSLLVAAGDLMGASPPISAFFDEQPTIQSMNAMGLSVTALGNHELDNGLATLLDRLAGRCAGQAACEPARYAYLGANFKRADGSRPLAATAVREVGGVKIGFIGEILQGADKVIAAKATRSLVFEEEARAANAAAAALQAQGVHFLVLLIHEGGDQNPAGGREDPNGCVNFTGDILPVLKRLSPAIRIVVSGHTHRVYNCLIDGRRVTSAASYGRVFTRITAVVDPVRDTVLRVDAVNEVVTRDGPRDAQQTAILDRWRPGTQARAGKVVGTTSAALPRRGGPAGESPLGDVLADAMLADAQAEEPTVQAAFTNIGGIRGSIGGPANGAPVHDVTYGELYSIMPFDNRLAAVTLTGDMIRRLLEQQFANPNEVHILQVSRGLAYGYRLNAPAGAHVDAASITIDGRPVRPGDRIRVATSDFLLAGGDGFTVFGEGTDRVVGPTQLETFIDYFAHNSPVGAGGRDRVRRLDAAAASPASPP